YSQKNKKHNTNYPIKFFLQFHDYDLISSINSCGTLSSRPVSAICAVSKTLNGDLSDIDESSKPCRTSLVFFCRPAYFFVSLKNLGAICFDDTISNELTGSLGKTKGNILSFLISDPSPGAKSPTFTISSILSLARPDPTVIFSEPALTTLLLTLTVENSPFGVISKVHSIFLISSPGSRTGILKTICSLLFIIPSFNLLKASSTCLCRLRSHSFICSEI